MTRRADYEELADVLVAVNKRDGYPVEGVDSPLAWLDLPDAIGQWTALLDGRPRGHAALLQPKSTDEVVGLVVDKQGVSMTQLAVLARLFVDPRVRGQGIGEALLKAAEDSARSLGLTLVLEVLAKDKSAMNLYLRNGWKVIGESDHVWGEGRHAEAMVMTKDKKGMVGSACSGNPTRILQ
ncbi:acetyltransferase [Janibacter hoylei PVAS-1]|uniref:Acetyltransferase n=1 Tax=Janibacter hoylei PVAS-1 TaxID=1210046 RepID=K1E125_9MICO|nr:acetyltransferase [Janibacter hoylei PVAS-1]